MTRPAVSVSEWMVHQHLSLDESPTLRLSQSAKTKENNFRKTYIAGCKIKHAHARACVFLIEIMDSFQPTMFVQQRVVPSSEDMACWLCGKLHVTQLQNLKLNIHQFPSMLQADDVNMLSLTHSGESFLTFMRFRKLDATLT